MQLTLFFWSSVYRHKGFKLESSFTGSAQVGLLILCVRSACIFTLEAGTLVPVEGGVPLGDSAYPSRIYLLTPVDCPGTAAEEK